MPMNYSIGAKTFSGLAATLNLKALDFLMRTNSFHRTEDKIVPPITEGSHDGYADLVKHPMGQLAPVRYMARYYRTTHPTKKLIDKIIEKDTRGVVDFYKVVDLHKTGKEVAWKFDPSVAARFQTEAEQHIPDYHRVINMCIDLAKNEIPENANIIDVGSALGYTVDRFISAGFINTFGVDNSESMIAQSLHPDRVILGDALPDSQFKMILINWTLHFIVDKAAYLKDTYNKLLPNGILVISDKTSQSLQVKDLYYKFKEDNGVDPAYIKQKEQSLLGVMHTMSADWYHIQLREIGFQRVEILNARYGFVTFVCRK
jgi:ubiquinone/menaquinone biosynthesis C-methylase UbiE